MKARRPDSRFTLRFLQVMGKTRQLIQSSAEECLIIIDLHRGLDMDENGNYSIRYRNSLGHMIPLDGQR
ncbi:hypothetical protein E2C01_093223 [Portunus trituberculatus]|uniref:Uncharacterized protein n=1 Tax=Portunus trituberculatus TaxID=210409 RepID=A0A5B7JTF2_PORTR|nr:hypothetical protein [Portunus trituberculatus]